MTCRRLQLQASSICSGSRHCHASMIHEGFPMYECRQVLKGPLLLLAACTCGCSNALLQLELNINLSSLMLEYNPSPDSILHLPLQYTDVHRLSEAECNVLPNSCYSAASTLSAVLSTPSRAEIPG